MTLQHDLWRAKRNLEVTTTALKQALATLDVTRDDLFKVAADGRLDDVAVLWSPDVIADVLGVDGRVDLERLEIRIRRLMVERVNVVASNVGAAS